MNHSLYYQWKETIAKQMKGLSKPQCKLLALVSFGVLLAQHCHLRLIAKFIPGDSEPKSKEERIRNFLDNERLTRSAFFAGWLAWAMKQFAKSRRITIIVDETTIGNQFRAMMVSLAYKKRAVPLIFRCYRAQSSEGYPDEGQVQMIVDMLRELLPHKPRDREVIVQADRGIGNSPNLCKAIASMGWFYCFRLPRNVKIHTDFGKLTPIEQAKPGKGVKLSGTVFVSKGKVPADIRIWWDLGHAQPWILVTNHPRLNPKSYIKRNWIEQSFRDFKSNGFHLSECRLRSPENIERLLMALTLAMGVAIHLGCYARYVLKKARKRVKDGKLGWMGSVFKIGLYHFQDCIAPNEKLPRTHFFMPRRA